MNFDQLIQYKALEQINTLSGSDAIDTLPDAQLEKSQMRNVCAMITIPLFDQLENLCRFLNISKRQFIEASLIESIAKANVIMKDVGLFEALGESK